MVGVEKLHANFFIKRTVRVGHKGPRNAINPGQAGQWLVLQYRQCQKISAGQAVGNFLELRLDQVKVVKQPLRRRADVIAAFGLIADVPVGQAQHADVVAQTRKKSSRKQPGFLGAVGRPQTAAMLAKALQAKDFGTDGWLRGTLRAVKHRTQNCRCIWHQAQ